MKIFLNKPKSFHHMNRAGFFAMVEKLGFSLVESLKEADIVYSPARFLNTKRHCNKIYIFGPHFSTFPNKQANSLSNKYGNAVYIHPSLDAVKIWKDDFSFESLPIRAFPFPLIMSEYSLFKKEKKDLVLIYYKMRDPKDLERVTQFFEKKQINYKIIKYGEYKEEDYRASLGRSRCVVWLGCHESQGFALQAALAKNVPVLVWSVEKMSQEWNCDPSYSSVKTRITTVPYWDETCGLVFYDFYQLEKSFEKFIANLSHYTPRKYIEDNLSVPVCSERFLELISEIKRNMALKSQSIEKNPSFLQRIKRKISDLF